MIRQGGYVGINFYPAFLNQDGKADVDTVAEHIDHVCQLGGEKHVGFGSDLDGIECCPRGLEHAGQIPHLLSALAQAWVRRGYPFGHCWRQP